MIKHPTIRALGYSEAAALIKSAADGIAAVISIHGRHEYGVEFQCQHRLDLCFDDVDSPDGLDLVAQFQVQVRRRWEAEHGKQSQPPTRKDAQSIVDFARTIGDLQGLVLCQCNGGVSRSPAAAILCLVTWIGTGRENECVREVFAGKPFISPHPDLIRFGDEILGCNGCLIEACVRRG